MSLTQTTFSIDSSESMITVIHLTNRTSSGLDSKRPSNASLNCNSFASAATSTGPNGLSIGLPAPGTGSGAAAGSTTTTTAMGGGGGATGHHYGAIASPRSPMSPISPRSPRRCYSPSLLSPGDQPGANTPLYQARVEQSQDTSPPGTGGFSTPRRASSELLTEETDTSLSFNNQNNVVASASKSDDAKQQADCLPTGVVDQKLANKSDDRIRIHSPSSSSEPLSDYMRKPSLNSSRQPVDNFGYCLNSPTEVATPDDNSTTFDLREDICMMSASSLRNNHERSGIETGQINEQADSGADTNTINSQQQLNNADKTCFDPSKFVQNPSAICDDEATFEAFCKYKKIHRVINDFCIRHTREELEFLIGRVGNLKIIECYFSERHKTLCMIVEVIE